MSTSVEPLPAGGPSREKTAIAEVEHTTVSTAIVRLLLAGLIVWSAPQTWDWTRTITLQKAAALIAVFVLSVGVLATQSYNPFIYFFF